MLKQRMVARLKTIKVEFVRRKHDRISQVDAWLRKVVTGYYQYHAVPGNIDQMRTFRQRVNRLWRSVLVRRSQRAKRRWESLTRSSTGGYPYPDSCIPTLTPDSTPLILHKSRMRRRARTDPSWGGRSMMSVPTGTIDRLSHAVRLSTAMQKLYRRTDQRERDKLDSYGEIDLNG
jgi:hypothetical protein